jgi:tetratricopeptide (TPR) repeat protein
MKDKIVISLFLLNLFGCNYKGKNDEYRKDLNAGLSNSRDEQTNIFVKKIDGLIETKQYLIAKEKLDSIIKLQPNSSVYFYNRGVCHTQLMMHQEAIEDFNKALKMNYKKDACKSMISFNKMLITN